MIRLGMVFSGVLYKWDTKMIIIPAGGQFNVAWILTVFRSSVWVCGQQF